MSGWFWEIFFRPDEKLGLDSGDEREDFNCCTRSNSKPKTEERLVSPRSEIMQAPTPWIREGYSPSSRQAISRNQNLKKKDHRQDKAGHVLIDDIARLRAEILEIERAIDEGERRISMLDVASTFHSSESSKCLLELRGKAYNLSLKLNELEALTSPAKQS